MLRYCEQGCEINREAHLATLYVRKKDMIPDIGDIIEIVRDIPEKNCVPEAVVHCHGNDVYEVEFTDDNGETLDFSALHVKHFLTHRTPEPSSEHP